jgi:N-acetylglutamate synthase-like GNAT family acetyltransferase
MNEIIYRKSNKDDLPQIIALLTKLGLDKSEPIGSFVLAVNGVQVLGCARIKEMKDGSLELASVAVEDKRRGKGIGRNLVKIVVANEPRRPLYLMCRKSRQRFYEFLGFKVIDEKELPLPIREEFIFRCGKLGKSNIKGVAMRLDD